MKSNDKAPRYQAEVIYLDGDGGEGALHVGGDRRRGGFDPVGSSQFLPPGTTLAPDGLHLHKPPCHASSRHTVTVFLGGIGTVAHTGRQETCPAVDPS